MGHAGLTIVNLSRQSHRSHRVAIQLLAAAQADIV